MKNKFKFMVLLLAMLNSACASSSGELIVRDAWARPAATGANGAAYFIIENGTGVDDTLLSVSSNIASATEIHRSMADENGVMSMDMQESVVVPAGEDVEFKPGGLHVMFVGLKEDITVGNTMTLILKFQDAGELSVQVPVQEP